MHAIFAGLQPATLLWKGFAATVLLVYMARSFDSGWKAGETGQQEC